MLDARLRCVARQVRPGSRLADIGTDHAFLPVWLVENGVCPRAIASDLRPGPAAAARRTIEAAGLADRLEVRVGDGLSPLKAGEVDDIVMAGMGGETMAAILDACSWAKDGRLHWVFQPMTRPQALRRTLLTQGFSILGEEVAAQGERLYVVLRARYDGTPPVTQEAAYYIGALPAKEGAAWLLGQSRHLRRQAAGLRHRGDREEAARLDGVAAQIERYVARDDTT